MCWSLMTWLCSIARKYNRHDHHSSSQEINHIANWENVEWAYKDRNIPWSIHWSSLKERTGNKSVTHAWYCWKCCLSHDNMLMSTTSINQLLSCTSTKHKHKHLGHVSLEYFVVKAVKVVVVCDTDYQPTEAHQGTFSRGAWYTHSSVCLSEHSMPFWAFKSASYRRSTSGLLTNVNVLILLIDLVSHDYLGVITMLILLIEKTGASCWSHQKDLNKLPPVPWWK